MKILPTNHIRDPKGQFIQHGGQLVCDEPIGSTEHHITASLWIRIRYLQPPTRQTLVLPAPGMTGSPTGAGITGQASQLAARAAAWEHLPAAPKPGQPTVVDPFPTALQDRRTIPIQAEPAQICLDRFDGAGSIARGIEIVDAQQPAATPLTSLQPREQGRLKIPLMQHARRRGRITAAIATRAAQQKPLVELSLQMVWNRHQKGGPLGAAITLNTTIGGTDQP